MESNVSLFDYLYARFGLYRFDVGRKINLYRRFVKNWYLLPFLKLGAIRDSDIVFRDGAKFRVRNYNDYLEFLDGWMSDKVESIFSSLGIDFNRIFRENSDVEYKYIVNNFWHIFIDEAYGSMRVQDRLVIDVGAFVGDSVIYFVLKGAGHVYAFEPSRKHFELARSLVEYLGLDKKVTLLNAAISSSGSKVFVSSNKISPYLEVDSIGCVDGYWVKAYTLDEVFREFGIKHCVLKLDCEGCEYGAVINSEYFGYIVHQVQIEYHYGYRNIVERLRNLGYRVRYTRPILDRSRCFKSRFMYMGWVYADRV